MAENPTGYPPANPKPGIEVETGAFQVAGIEVANLNPIRAFFLKILLHRKNEQKGNSRGQEVLNEIKKGAKSKSEYKKSTSQLPEDQNQFP